MQLPLRYTLLLSAIIAISAGFALFEGRLGTASGLAAGKSVSKLSSASGGNAAGTPGRSFDVSSPVGRGANTPVPDSLPGTLAGTREPDGWAVLDAQGLPTPELRALFEYYLAALGYSLH